MNSLERIEENLRNYIKNKKDKQEQIKKIENQRIDLSCKRNEKKAENKINNNANTWEEINLLGRQISELGNQSQKIQNQIDTKLVEIKAQAYIEIDNLIVEELRKMHIIDEEIQEMSETNSKLEEKSLKYELEKQEFFTRFGRMPELSQKAIQESKKQQEIHDSNIKEIKKLNSVKQQTEQEIQNLSKTKRKIKHGEIYEFLEDKQQSTIQTITNHEEIEDISIEIENEPIVEEKILLEVEPIEEIKVEEFEPIQEIQVEELEPIQEIQVEELGPIQEMQIEEFKQEEMSEDSEEDLIREIEKQLIEEQDIITFEENKKNIDIIEEINKNLPLAIQDIVIKIENKELVYKAQISNGEEIIVYPCKESKIIDDKKTKKELKEKLAEYSKIEYKQFDKNAIRKIDPIICTMLSNFAEKYNQSANNLIYNYVMSFSNNGECDYDLLPQITYNLSYIKEANISKKEQKKLEKICANANKNDQINTIGLLSKTDKIKYFIRKTFNITKAKLLTEGKTQNFN